MTDLFNEPDDATPLAPEEREGLRQNWITLRSELNAAEQDNIVSGATWARRPRQVRRELLDDGFARTLHQRMFGDVWSWAGTYRTTERNIGVDAHRIPNDTIMMFDDVRYWREHAVPHADSISFHIGVVGMFLASINCPADTTALQNDGAHDLGHAVLLAPGTLERLSLREIAQWLQATHE